MQKMNQYIFILLLSAFSSISFAKSPQDIVTDFLQLGKEKKWDRLVEFYDPKEIEEFKSVIIEYLEYMPEHQRKKALNDLSMSSIKEVKEINAPDIFSSMFGEALKVVNESNINMFQKPSYISEPIQNGEYLHFVVSSSFESEMMNADVETFEVLTLVKRKKRYFVRLPLGMVSKKISLKMDAENNKKRKEVSASSRPLITTGTTQISGGSLSKPQPPIGSGKRLDEEIQTVMYSQRSYIYSIYQRELRKGPTFKGEYEFQIIIEESGIVSGCDLIKKGGEREDFASKICKRIMKIDFFPKKNSGKTTIAYPINFSPA